MKKFPVKVVLDLPSSYLQTIKHSAGVKLFRNLFAWVDGKHQDILKNGNLSCAVLVSGILVLYGLVEKTHATVNGLVADLERSGWKKIKLPRAGAVLIWDYLSVASKPHLHTGFYIGNNQAISNSTAARVPKLHHWTYGTKNGNLGRKVLAIYWHKKLEK